MRRPRGILDQSVGRKGEGEKVINVWRVQGIERPKAAEVPNRRSPGPFETYWSELQASLPEVLTKKPRY